MSSSQSACPPSAAGCSAVTNNNKRLRFACDRCRFQKLRCPRTLQNGKSVDMFEPCSRCLNAGEQCMSSLRGKVGRPRKDSSINQDNNGGKRDSRGGDKSRSNTPTSKGKGHNRTNSDQETDNGPTATAAFPSLPIAMTAATNPSNKSTLDTPRSDHTRGVDIAPNLRTSYMPDASPAISVAESIPESRPHPWSLRNLQTPLSSEHKLVSPGRDTSLSTLDEPNSVALNNYGWPNGSHAHEDIMLDQLMNDHFELHSGLEVGIDNSLNIYNGDDIVPMASSRQQGPTPLPQDDEFSIALQQYKLHSATTEILMNGFITPQTDSGTEEYLGPLPQHQYHHQPQPQQPYQLRQHPQLQQTDFDQPMRPMKKMRRDGLESAAGLQPVAAKASFSNTACFQRLSELNIRILQHSRRTTLDRQLAGEIAPFCQELIDIVRHCLPHSIPNQRGQQQHHASSRGAMDNAASFSDRESSTVPDSALIFLILSCYTQLLQVFRVTIGRHSVNTTQHHPHSNSLFSPSSTHSGNLMSDSSDRNPDAMASRLKASLTVHTVTYLVSQLQRTLGQYYVEGGEDLFSNMYDEGQDGQDGQEGKDGDNFVTVEEDDGTEDTEDDGQDMASFGLGGDQMGVSLPLTWNRKTESEPVSGNAAALGKIACWELNEHERDLTQNASLLEHSSRNSNV